MPARRNSAAEGLVGFAKAGAAPASPVLPRPALSRSSLTPSYSMCATVPMKSGLRLIPSPLQATSVTAPTASASSVSSLDTLPDHICVSSCCFRTCHIRLQRQQTQSPDDAAREVINTNDEQDAEP